MSDSSQSGKWVAPVITTLLFGAAAASLLSAARDQDRPSASTDDDEMWRNQYASREACVADYSDAECREEATGGGGFWYLGPWYRPRATVGPGPGRARVANPAGIHDHTVQVQRGGFGRSARAYGGFRGG